MGGDTTIHKMGSSLQRKFMAILACTPKITHVNGMPLRVN
jgi:hypothetical protein